MPQINRPVKQGGATTYGGKVSAGYTTILASEMDADLDTIYSAWNSGVDGTNIQPGSITGDKLAPGAVGSRELADSGVATVDLADQAVTTAKLADSSVNSAKIIDGSIATVDLADGSVTQAKLSGPITPSSAAGGDLSGSYPNPSLGVVQGSLVKVNPRVLMYATAGTFDSYGNDPNSPAFDNTKPSWLCRLNYTGDQFEVWRSVPPGTSYAANFWIRGSDGRTVCNLSDGSVARNHIAPNAPCGGPVYVNIPVNTTWGSGGALGWTTVASLSITTRGGSVALFVSSNLAGSGPAGGGNISVRWLRDNTTQVTGANYKVSGGGYAAIPGPAWFDGAPGAGAHTYAFQIALDPNCFVTSSNLGGGGILAMEVG